MQTLIVPFQIDSRGGLASTTSTQVIVEQQIADILVTARYERIMNPQYGADVPGFIFTPLRDQVLVSKADEIKDLLNHTLTLATVVSVRLEPVAGADSTLALDVRYTISPSPAIFVLQRTISGLITDEASFGVIL